MPGDPVERAQVMRWLLFEQTGVMMQIGGLRFRLLTGRISAEAAERRRRGALAGLAVLEAHLERYDFFVADRYGIADIAIYGYTHVAGEAGIDLADFPAVASVVRAGRRPGRPRKRPRALSGERHGRGRAVDLRLAVARRLGRSRTARADVDHLARRVHGEREHSPRMTRLRFDCAAQRHTSRTLRLGGRGGHGSWCPHLAMLLESLDQLHTSLAAFYRLGAGRNGWVFHRSLPEHEARDRAGLEAAGLDVASLEAEGRFALSQAPVDEPPESRGRSRGCR